MPKCTTSPNCRFHSESVPSMSRDIRFSRPQPVIRNGPGGHTPSGCFAVDGDGDGASWCTGQREEDGEFMVVYRWPLNRGL